MNIDRVRKALTTASFLSAMAVGAVSGSSTVQAAGNDDSSFGEKSRISSFLSGFEDERHMIQIGLDIAKAYGLQLNLRHKDPDMVGLGSYLVNVVADCNGCHSDPRTTFAPAGNPYFLPGATPPNYSGATRINAATYLGGGQSFGSFGPGPKAEIISRNLTPDKTGRPEGGNTLSEFMHIMRTGLDPDKVHPSCSSTITTNCLAFPFNGALLQVMPWPAYRHMTDRQLTAMYVYLSAIPCVEGGPGEPANRCK